MKTVKKLSHPKQLLGWERKEYLHDNYTDSQSVQPAACETDMALTSNVSGPRYHLEAITLWVSYSSPHMW